MIPPGNVENYKEGITEAIQGQGSPFFQKRAAHYLNSLTGNTKETYNPMATGH